MAVSQQMIYCETKADFFECVRWCVEQGLTFKAQSDTCTIYLTGGY